MSIRKILQTYPKLSKEVAAEIIRWDPGRYYLWIAKQVSKGEDLSEVFAVVVEFHARRQRLPPGKRDIHAVKSLNALRKIVDSVSPVSNRKSKQESKGYTEVADFENVTYYRLDTYEGALALSKDTKWCITDEDRWKDYRDRLILVVVVKNKKRRDRFSKFAIVLRRPLPVSATVWMSFEYMRTMSLAFLRGEFDMGKIIDTLELYDEQDIYAQANTASVELIRVLSGGDNFAKTIVQEVTRVVSFTDKPRLRDVITVLGRGKTLTDEEFKTVVDAVIEDGLLDPTCLFTHPKANKAECRNYLWEKAQKVPVSGHKRIRLLDTPAVAVPTFVEAFLACLEDGLKGWSHKKAKDVRRAAMIRFMGASHLNRAGKELVLNWFARTYFKLKKYTPDLSNPATPINGETRDLVYALLNENLYTPEHVYDIMVDDDEDEEELILAMMEEDY